MSEGKEDIITDGRAFLIHEGRRYQITSVHCGEPYTEKEKQYVDFHFEGTDLIEGTEFSMNLRLEARYKRELEYFKQDPRPDKTLLIDVNRETANFRTIYGSSKNPEYPDLIEKRDNEVLL
jgi:thymidylate kinase